jgi:hypothetical protein
MLEWKYKLSLNREKTKATAEIVENLSVSFEITRTTQITPSVAKFTVSNLAENTRNAFEKMKPMDYTDVNGNKIENYGMDDYCSVIFSVQRDGGKECIIFKGDLVECYSERDSGEWNTYFDCSDGFFAMRYASMNGHYEKDGLAKANFEKEAKKWKLATELNGQPVKTEIPVTVNEKFTDTLNWAFPNNWYIDCNTLITGTPKNPTVYKVEKEWLEKTPKREENILRIATMFLPEPRLGNILEVESDIYGNMGQWEIAEIIHKGEFPAGDMGSEFALIPPGARFNE